MNQLLFCHLLSLRQPILHLLSQNCLFTEGSAQRGWLITSHRAADEQGIFQWDISKSPCAWIHRNVYLEIPREGQLWLLLSQTLGQCWGHCPRQGGVCPDPSAAPRAQVSVCVLASGREVFFILSPTASPRILPCSSQFARWRWSSPSSRHCRVAIVFVPHSLVLFPVLPSSRCPLSPSFESSLVLLNNVIVSDYEVAVSVLSTSRWLNFNSLQCPC